MRLQHAQLPEEAREPDKELKALLKDKEAAIRWGAPTVCWSQVAVAVCASLMELILGGVLLVINMPGCFAELHVLFPCNRV